MIYKLIGKAVVKSIALFARQRYGRLRIGLVVAAVLALGIGAFLASRQVEEG